MQLPPFEPPYDEPWVVVLEESEDYRFGDLFRIVRARLRYRRFDGRLSQPVTRISFERGDSVGVLLHDPLENSVVLVRQFRFPVYARLGAEYRAGQSVRQAWLLEIVAGVQAKGERSEDVANRELFEEVGLKIKGHLRLMTTVYPSPGGTSERIHLFLGEVDSSEVDRLDGGLSCEGEDIQIVVLPLQAALDMVVAGEIQDAKTVIALQYLALRGALDRGVAM